MLRDFAAAAPWPIWAKRAEGDLRLRQCRLCAGHRGRQRRRRDRPQPRTARQRPTAPTMDRALNDNASFSARLPIVVGGERRIYDVQALKLGGGSAGIAIDASEADRAARRAGADGGGASPHPRSVVVRRRGVRRASGGSPSTTIPIAGCGTSTAPSSTAIPTIPACSTGCAPRANCRSSRISGPGRPSCTRPIAPSSPRRTPGTCPTAARVSVVTTPNPEGGVTYLFDDVTESLDLARRFDGLIRVQRETLDNLAEAVAVFGSNGRAQLFNPAFARMWKLSPEALQEQPHIETVEALVQAAVRRRADLADAARGHHRDREPGRRCR